MRPIDKILAQIPCKKQRSGYKGRCPAHDDRSASLSIGEADDRVLVYCQAGCKTEDVLAAVGLKFSDLFPEKPEPEPPVYYTYTDREGLPAYRKVRKFPKQFFIERLEDSRWVTGLNGKAPDLYNVVRVIDAVRSGKAIWFVEGEKDADTLARKGVVATTNILGAGKWHDSYSKTLKGAKVVIVADKDKAGYEHALKVYEALRHGCKVKVVEAKDGKDASDHFSLGYGIDEFVEIGERGLKQRLGIVPRAVGWTMADNVEQAKVDWLFEPYIPVGEVTLMAGDPGEGKSTTAQAIATACTNGSEICGRPIKQGPVVFMSAEQSRSTVTVPRFKDMGADLSKIALPDEDGDDGEPKPFVLDEDGFATLEQFVGELGPVLIVVDTITAYIEAQRDFNSANQVREWMRRLAKIARQHECAVLVLGHLNKNTQAKGNYRIMGSVDFVGAARSVLFIGHDPDKPGHRAMMHNKSNVGPIGPALGYSIEDGVFGWTGESDLDVDRMNELPQTKDAREARAECGRLITDHLAENGYETKDKLQAKAKAEGFGSRCFTDALHDVAEKFKDGLDGGFYWRRKGV